MRYTALGCFSLLLFAAPADAEWLEASSDHFVIYADQREKAVNAFSERLERFHAAMTQVFPRKRTKPSPSNRLTVFVVSSKAQVREITGTKNRFVAGTYMSRAGSRIALVPTVTSGLEERELSGETILYHEYAHDFMINSVTSRAYPRWFVEGFAEFFAGVRFRADGRIALGIPPAHRAAELAFGREVPIRRLLDFDGGAGDSRPDDAFYGQSWALFHYLQMAPERDGQILKYHRLLATGDSAVEAAAAAFGDLDELRRHTESYLKRRRLTALVVDGNALTVGPIAVRKLRPGEAAMMPILIESKVGVSEEEALALVPEARKVAARYPDDPAVLAALAEAEFDAGNDEAAIAAADRALALDPREVNAYIQKGYALARQIESGALSNESWRDVREQFVKANSVENDHPVPLIQFYLTYLKQGQRPTRNAIEGLEWALQLAPFDRSLRLLVVEQMIADQRYEHAWRTVAPLAYSPHPGELTDKARQLLKEVEGRLEIGQQSSSVQAE